MPRTILLLPGASSVAGDLWDKLAERTGAKIVSVEPHTKEEFQRAVQDTTPEVIVNTFWAIKFGGWTPDVVQGLPSSVKAVCSIGAGYDPMGDMAHFKAKGIQVSNTPNGVIQATADTGLYLILGTLRNFGRLNQDLINGKFNEAPLGDEYDGKTLGIIGLGGIGSVIRDKVEAAFDFAKIQYYNRHRADPDVEKDSVYVDSLETLLATSDVLVVAVPLNSGTRHMLNRDTLAKLKKGAIIVNIARGPIIDEEALGDALESGDVKAVGLDVFEFEPKINPKVKAHPNSLLLPHVGTHTGVSRGKMGKEVIANVESYLTTGKVISLVPELR